MRILLMLFIASLALSACGRRGPPSPPGPASDVTYPRTYPAN